MFRRASAVGALAVSAAVFPATGHGAPAPPTEKQVRQLEARLLGAGHAAEHAHQRVVRRQASAPEGGRLRADNELVEPDVGGFWAPAVDLPVVAIHSTMMRTGKVLIFAYPWRPGRTDPDTGAELGDPGYSTAYVFDPATGRSKQIDPPIDPDTGKPAYIFCAGTSLLPDGRVLVVGGNVGDPTAAQNKGLNTVFTFDPATESWQTHERTRQGRWYPTLLEIGDGRTLLFAGIPKPGDPDWSPGSEYRINTDLEIFDHLSNDVGYVSSLRADEQPGNPPLPGQYPHMWWMPSGHALVAGPRKSDTWRLFPPTPNGDDASWSDLPDMPAHREWAPGVLLPNSSKIVLFGGADRDDHVTSGYYPANGSTTTFDDAAPELGWQPGPDMRVERAFHNAVQLPDGRVALVGGGFGEDDTRRNYRWEFRDAQKRVEVFDPVTGAFTLGNAQAEGRTYHSSALLLPDGRVMSAGDDINGPLGPESGVRTDTAEIWSPPYLFEQECEPRPRPVLEAAPASIAYGAPFAVDVSGVVREAVLVAPGADTHNNDMSQRVVPLADPLRDGGTATLVAPASGDLAPPGYYMLFLLDGRGTPSVARFVHLGGTDPGLAPDVAAGRPPDACERVEVAIADRPPRAAKVRRTGRLTVRVASTRPGTVIVRGRAFRAPASVKLGRAGSRRLTLRLRRSFRDDRALVVRAVAKARTGAPGRDTVRLRLR